MIEIEKAGRSALFTMQTRDIAGQVLTAKITSGGLAQAALADGVESWVTIGHKWLTPDQSLASAATKRRPSDPHWLPSARLTQRIPVPVATALKDIRNLHRRTIQLSTPQEMTSPPLLVWQRHNPFDTSGLELATRLGVPSVLSVHALAAREAANWGVRRRGYRYAFEQLAEAPSLRRADILICVSDQVAHQVHDLVGRTAHVLPNGVDTDLFTPPGAGDTEDQDRRRFTIGWCGSFRRFHGLHRIIDAFAQSRDLRSRAQLLFVGDGPLRKEIEDRCQSAGIDAKFTGLVDYLEMPAWIRKMDVGLVLTDDPDRFHYSPVKLWEYAACGVPVVAHAAGQLVTTVSEERNGFLVDPHSGTALARKLIELSGRRQDLRSIGQNARATAVDIHSWKRRWRDLRAIVEPGS